MKSPEKTAFETILLIAALIALALLPLTAKAACGMQHQPPAFTEFDVDGDGRVSEAEFNAFHAAHHEQMAKEGRPMKGMASAPTFADADSNDDGYVNEAELTAAQQAHHAKMQEAHQGMGGGMQHGKRGGMTMPSFGDLDLNGDGCINAEEFAKHQAEMHM